VRLAVAVAVAVAAGSVVGLGPLGVAVSVGDSGGRVGGIGVDVGSSAKMEVWVRFGVGNVKGVGADTPGSVQLVNTSSTAERRIVRIPFAILNLHVRVRLGLPKIFT
jgi:hypothetical protein